jgi:hypothetical protein
MKKTAKNFGAVVVVLAALSGAMAASCDNGSGGPIPPQTPAPAVQDVTVPLTLFGESLYLVCPPGLLSESQSKINDVILVMEATWNGNSAEVEMISLLSTNEVKIIVKNDGSVASCEKSGPFTMTISYQWLQTSAENTIVNAMGPVFGQMLP